MNSLNYLHICLKVIGNWNGAQKTKRVKKVISAITAWQIYHCNYYLNNSFRDKKVIRLYKNKKGIIKIFNSRGGTALGVRMPVF